MCELFLKCFSNSIVTYMYKYAGRTFECVWHKYIYVLCSLSLFHSHSSALIIHSSICMHLWAFFFLVFSFGKTAHLFYFLCFSSVDMSEACVYGASILRARERAIFSGFICLHFVILQNITPLKSVKVAPVAQSHQ